MSDGVPRRSPASVPLLGGRGPGASDTEVDAHTSERTLYAGRPVVEQLAQLHERTAAACGDADAMRRDLSLAPATSSRSTSTGWPDGWAPPAAGLRCPAW